jgi:hypothetical protein
VALAGGVADGTTVAFGDGEAATFVVPRELIK